MVVFKCLNLIGILTIIDVPQVEALMSGMDHKKYINTFINNLVSAETWFQLKLLCCMWSKHVPRLKQGTVHGSLFYLEQQKK